MRRTFPRGVAATPSARAVRTLADSRVARTLLALLTAIAALVLTGMLWDIVARFAHTLLLLLFGSLLAFVIGPAISALERRGVPRALSVLGVYLVLIGGIATGVALAVGPLTAQLTAINEHLPRTISNFSKGSPQIDRTLTRFHLPPVHNLRQTVTVWFQHQASGLLSDALAILTTIVSLIVDIVLVLVLSIYLLIDARRIHDNIFRIVPERHRDRAFFVEAAVQRVLGGYIRGQLLMALLIGVLYGVGCWVLGVHYPLVIGILAGLFELMPMIGPVLGAIPALAIALTQSFSLAIWVIVYYVVIQQLESHVIGPRITGSAVGLHPIGAILALVAGVEFGGLLGALLGVPAAGLLYVLVVAIYWEYTGSPAAPATRTPWQPLRVARAGMRLARRESGPESVTGAAVSMVGEATPQPQALAAIGDKAVVLRDTFERTQAEAAPGDPQAVAGPPLERAPIFTPEPEDEAHEIAARSGP